jgi:hypothetical protein
MADDCGPMITGKFADGPISGATTEVPAVEGRPPKTIDVDGPGDARSRYCLADWEQSGQSAVYTLGPGRDSIARATRERSRCRCARGSRHPCRSSAVWRITATISSTVGGSAG